VLPIDTTTDTSEFIVYPRHGFCSPPARRRIATAQKSAGDLYSQPAKEAAMDRGRMRSFGVN
jgi:hypothetical protein